jgi:hypothetical protein
MRGYKNESLYQVAPTKLSLQDWRSAKLRNSQCLMLSILLFFLALLSLNVDPVDSLKLTIATLLQIIPGFYLWARVNNRGQTPLSELIGMGLAIGTLLCLISSALLRTLPFGEFGWIAPFLLTMLTLLARLFRSKGRNRTESLVKSESNTLQARGFLFITLILSYTQVFVWSRWHSLNPKGWWKYHLDVPYFEALSNSIALLGTSNSLMKPDLETRYHWFAYGWVGSLNQSLNLDPFIVQTRLLPLVAMIMAASIAFSWTKDFTNKGWIAATASLIIVVGPGFAIGSLVMLRSPSSAMAAGWTLAFSLFFFRCLRAPKIELHKLFTLCLLSVGVVAGKGVNVLIIGSAVTALLLNDLLLKRALRFKKLQIYMVVLTSLIASYFSLIHTPDGRSLKFGIYLGWPALILTVLPLTLGVFLKSYEKIEEHQHLKLYSIGALLGGVILSLVTSDTAGGQIYFVICAITLCVVPSLIHIERYYLDRMKDSNRPKSSNALSASFRIELATLILFAGLLSSGTWIYFENRVSIIGDIGRATAPVLIWIIAMIGTLTMFSRKKLHSYNLKLTFTMLTLAITVVSSSVGILTSMVRGPIYADSQDYVGYGKSLVTNPGSVSSNYFKAGDWVKQNTNLKERFFTNRQCLDPKSRYENCLDLWFFASALSQRQYLIEGGAYNIIEDEYMIKMNEDQRVSLRFSLTPNLADLQYLWSNGVRWGWIDKKVVNRKDWQYLARSVYSNEDISIIQLINPNMFKATSS